MDGAYWVEMGHTGVEVVHTGVEVVHTGVHTGNVEADSMVGTWEDMSTEGAGAEGHTEWAGTDVELVVGSDMGGAGKDMWVADVDVAGTVGAWVQKQPRAFFLAHSELARGPCFVVALLPFVSSTLPNSSRGAHYQSQSL